MYALTTNDKTIKLWKISQKNLKKIVKTSDAADFTMPQLEIVEPVAWRPSLRKTYPSLHMFNINSISASHNEEFLLSSDDLRVNLWSLEQPNKAFIAVDIKPANLDELDEVVTSSQFHPYLDSVFLYSTSLGVIKIGDMRKAAVCDNIAVTLAQ